MQDPIDRLLREHQGIMRQVADLRGAIQALADGGDEAAARARPILAGTARMIESELLPHARREDEALFPAIERALSEQGMTRQMRREHVEIHAQADRFRATLKQLNEVEHPAIVAGGAKLSELAAAGGDARTLGATGAELIHLLDDHFMKEEQILFPIAREVLEPDELAEVARLMETLDAS